MSDTARRAECPIRRLAGVDDYIQCEELQRRVWHFRGDLDVIPRTQLVAAQKAGGIVLGAFDAGGQLVGFCYGFRGEDDRGRALHYSHMLAVDVSFRSTGLGARLKWTQREVALQQGLHLMAWTFDPLQSLNSHFNFGKLGVVAETYFENLYGETTSLLHQGSPTDRLLAAWHLDTARVAARERGERGVLAQEIAAGRVSVSEALSGVESGDAVSIPGRPKLHLDAPHVACEIPTSIQEVMKVDPAAVLAWRMATREVFQHYLGRGYFVRECVRFSAPAPRTLFVFERGSPEATGAPDHEYGDVCGERDRGDL